MKRAGIVGLLAMVVGASGCAGTTKRDDGTMMFQPRAAWSAAPAPEQVVITQAPAPAASPMPAIVADAGMPAKAGPLGLSKYFPGLRKGTTEPTKLAIHRPTWFGLRKPKQATQQVYTTDARPGLGRGAEPSLLPVALRVPSDPSVRPTSAEAAAAKPEPADPRAERPAGDNPAGLDGQVLNRMPEVPPVDPLGAPKAAEPEVARAPEGEKAPAADRTADDKAVLVVASPAEPIAPPSAAPSPVMMPASYVQRDTMVAPAHVHAPRPGTVLASPQVQPTSKVAPSPQNGATNVAAKKWQRPCLRRYIRKTWCLGEYANPPTAAPH